MPRRRKQSDLEILFELLFDIGRVLVDAILSIFRGMFGLFNSNKTNFNIDWDEEVRKNLSSNSSSESNHKHIHIEPSKPKILTYWSMSLLNDLEWKRFEEVVSDYYRLIGYRSEVTRMGADGGVDVLLYQHGAETPAILVQCKAWSKKVGVNAVRELYGVMAADGVGYGIFATTSDYTNEAQQWVVGKSMQLLSGSNLVTMFNQLADDQRKEHLMNGLLGDYSTPTCPSCNQKMVRRTASKGKSVGSSFWGCANYPRCKQTFKIV